MTRKLTPMMAQYQAIKAKYPDAILFYRMGDFYEMFGEDARIAAPVMEVVLTSRDRKSENPIPMCGVPHHALDTYVARLIAKNFKVAICEQVEDPKEAKGIVKREVVRVITPGTVLESNLLHARENNYLAAVARTDACTGLSLVDLSTGEMIAMEFSGEDGDVFMENALHQWSAREVIYPESWSDFTVAGPVRLSPLEDWVFSVDYARECILDQFGVTHLDGFGLDGLNGAVLSAGALLHYLKGIHIDALEHITRIRVHHDGDFVVMDPASRRNLELTRTLMGGQREGSLLDYVDFTVTPMGGRLLKRRLEQPLRVVGRITQRLDMVEAYYSDDICRNDTRDIVTGISDMERLIGRVATGVAHARDLAGLRDSLEQLPVLKDHLISNENPVIQKMGNHIDPVESIYQLLLESIRDNPPINMKDGNIIREGYNARLDEIRLAARDGKSWIAGLQLTERERTGITTLKVKFNRVFGYFIDVTKSHLDKVPENYMRKQTLVNSERYITPELKEMEEKILGAEEKMVSLEQTIFREIRQAVGAEVNRIQGAADAVARIDVAAANAELANRYRYRRPVMADNDAIIITSGRHPVVERIPSSDGFVANDVRLDSEDFRLNIITGPNMAGKSTYIRQIALIVLLAQTGSFVPADAAEIGVVDRIFTRVGASDNLAGGQSTFMVEMSEAANILNNATKKSLVILDEVGRGTSTFDGLSIAWAVAEYLHEKASRTLFATHYHELTDLSKRLSGVKNFNVVVKEWNDQVVFLRKVVPGGVDRSYGIQVARLAGIPRQVLDRASEVLTALEMKDSGRVPRGRVPDQKRQSMQLELFSSTPSPLTMELDKLQLDSLTPLDALNLLARWKKEFTA